jgi:hypothetical protein
MNGNGAATVARQEKRNLSLFNNQKEVADYLVIHYSTVSRMVNKGILDYVRLCKKQDLTPLLTYFLPELNV